MVLGIIGLALCWIPFAGWLCALIGVILGALGISKAKKLGGKGKGMAVAGLVCGIVGLAIGVLLFVLAMMAATAFEGYVKKSKRSEAQLQLRSIETKVKTFRTEKGRFPKSAPATPTQAGPDCMYTKVPQSQWEQSEGWKEMGFHIDEDSRYQYEFTSEPTGARAVARGDLDCDGVFTETTMTLTVVDGNVVATYGEPTPD